MGAPHASPTPPPPSTTIPQPPRGGGGLWAGWFCCWAVRLLFVSCRHRRWTKLGRKGRVLRLQTPLSFLGRFPCSLPSLGVNPCLCARTASRSSVSQEGHVRLGGRSGWKTRRPAAMGTACSDSWDGSAADKGASGLDNTYAKVPTRCCAIHSAVQRVLRCQSLWAMHSRKTLCRASDGVETWALPRASMCISHALAWLKTLAVVPLPSI